MKSNGKKVPRKLHLVVGVEVYEISLTPRIEKFELKIFLCDKNIRQLCLNLSIKKDMLDKHEFIDNL